MVENADDLVPMPNYVPKTSWEHVMFTSRDQGIIGTLAKTGLLLDQGFMHGHQNS